MILPQVTGNGRTSSQPVQPKSVPIVGNNSSSHQPNPVQTGDTNQPAKPSLQALSQPLLPGFFWVQPNAVPTGGNIPWSRQPNHQLDGTNQPAQPSRQALSHPLLPGFSCVQPNTFPTGGNNPSNRQPKTVSTAGTNQPAQPSLADRLNCFLAKPAVPKR